MHKKAFAWPLILAGILWGICPAKVSAQQIDHAAWQIIEYPNAPVSGKPSLSQITLSSGPSILMARDTTIPIVTIAGMLPIGMNAQTSSSRGVIQVIAEGLAYHNPHFPNQDSARAWLSSRGILIETQLENEFLRVGMRLPAHEWKNGLAYLLQINQRNPFSVDQIERCKLRLASEIQMMEAVPWYNFSNELSTQYLGEEAWKMNETGDYPSVRKVDSAKVAGFLTAFPASYSTLMVGGDFNQDSLLNWVQDHLPTLNKPVVWGSNAEMPAVESGCREWLVMENELNTFPVIKLIWQTPGTEKVGCADEALELASIGLSIPGCAFYDALIGAGRAVEIESDLKRGRQWGEVSLRITPNPDSLDVCIAVLKQELGKIGAGNYFSETILTQAKQIFKLKEAHLREKTSQWIDVAAERKMLDIQKDFDPNRYITDVLNIPLSSLNSSAAQLFLVENGCGGVLTNSFYQPDLSWQLSAAVTDSKPEPLTLPDTIAFQKIYFKPNLAEPDEKSWEHIKLVASWLNRMPDVRIRIKGFTDGIGDGVKNYHLSIERADLIKRIFAEGFGISEERLVVQGMGEAFPDYPDDTPEHRALNRRVTFERISEVDHD